MEKLLSIGKILNFHGINGEVKVGYTAGKEEQLLKIKQIYALTELKSIPLTVTSVRFHKKYALIKFKEISSINEAIHLKGAVLQTEKSSVTESLDKDEFYIDDLVGLNVIDMNGKYLGVVSSVVNLGRGDLLNIKTEDGTEHLVPFVKELVPVVSINERKIAINAIPGLLTPDEAISEKS